MGSSATQERCYGKIRNGLVQKERVAKEREKVEERQCIDCVQRIKAWNKLLQSA
jgi:hypothetical protein